MTEPAEQPIEAECQYCGAPQKCSADNCPLHMQAPQADAQTPVAWIATSPSGRVLHFGVADGWQVEPVMFEDVAQAPQPSESSSFSEWMEEIQAEGKDNVSDLLELAYSWRQSYTAIRTRNDQLRAQLAKLKANDEHAAPVAEEK